MTVKKTTRSESTFIWGGLHPFSYHPILFSFIGDLRNKIILDCGCGKGIYGFLIRVTRPIEKGKLIGMDIRKEYLDFCRHYRIYDKLVQGDVTKLPFKDKSIDYLICSEVIEHLDAKKGRKLLIEIDRVCRERAIITTPNVFFQTFKEERTDAHHSIWNSSYFRERGYKVHGLGLKIKIDRFDKFYKFKQALSIMATPFSYFIPDISGSLVCVKDY